MTQYTDGLRLDSAIKSSGSLDDLQKTNFTYCNTNVSKLPIGTRYGYNKTTKYDAANIMQEYVSVTPSSPMFVRTWSNDHWNAWSPVGGLNRVFCKTTSNQSYTYTYQMSKDDFISYETDGVQGANALGMYLIFIITWSSSPTISIYSVGYSGGDYTYAKNCVTKIAGADVNITVSNTGLITVNSGGKVEIVAIV